MSFTAKHRAGCCTLPLEQIEPPATTHSSFSPVLQPHITSPGPSQLCTARHFFPSACATCRFPLLSKTNCCEAVVVLHGFSPTGVFAPPAAPGSTHSPLAACLIGPGLPTCVGAVQPPSLPFTAQRYIVLEDGGGFGVGAGLGVGGVHSRTIPPGWNLSPSAKDCETRMAALLVMIGQILSLVSSEAKSCPKIRGAEAIAQAPKCVRSSINRGRLPTSNTSKLCYNATLHQHIGVTRTATKRIVLHQDAFTLRSYSLSGYAQHPGPCDRHSQCE